MAGIQQVLTAFAVMASSSPPAEKKQAEGFLDTFQKSESAWSTTMDILNSADTSVEAKLFAAMTLKSKVTLDLDQLTRENLPALRESILSLIKKYANGPKPIRTQLCVCLAQLAIQMLEWKDVLEQVGSSLGNEALDAVLEFLRVLPEELLEGRKINLSEEELDARTKELLEANAGRVLPLLVQYSQSSAAAASNPYLLNCLTSWLKEIPLQEVVNSPLVDVMVHGVVVDQTSEAAVECLSGVFRDTREVDDSLDVIQILYPRILSLRPKIAEVADAQDAELLKALTRVFSECGEAWVTLVARMPEEFRGLVETVLECCARDVEKDAISQSFLFWYEFKQLIVMDKFIEARAQYADLWAKLVDVMIRHLEFPSSDGESDEKDLFSGDRELEEKFREFRHQMGDVLKDCCEVISVTDCLNRAFALVQSWRSTYAAAAAASQQVPHWQQLEAPIFALRAMGRLVPPDENVVLRQVIPVIVNMPEHEKLRFQGIMALARYTEWTAEHPEYLPDQFKFILASFSHPSNEIVRAAALAFRFFGIDCSKLLVGEIEGILSFYDEVLDKLTAGPNGSQVEMTEGVASVVSVQAPDQIYASLKRFVDPLVERLKAAANEAQSSPSRQAEEKVADVTHLITIFVDVVQPRYENGQTNQAVAYFQEILPITAAVANNFASSSTIVGEVCRLWRNMIFSYRAATIPILPELASQLADGFKESKQSSYLWASSAVLREFSDGMENVDPTTTQNVYKFFEQQAFSFLQLMNDLPPAELPDVIDEFSRLMMDALVYYHSQVIPSALCNQILSAAITSLSLESRGPLIVTINFIRDLLSYGGDDPNSSQFFDNPAAETNRKETLAKLKPTVRQLVTNQGEQLVQRTLTGMMFSFPGDVIQDASGVLLDLFRLVPRETASWISNTIQLLPAGSLKQGEGERLLEGVAHNVEAGDMRKCRVLLGDFASGYRRRKVAPREGLGRLEAKKFRLQE